MKRYLLLAAAIAMMTMMTVQADEPAPPSQPANAVVDSTAVAPVLKVELTTLKIVNGQASLCVKTRCYGAVALKDCAPYTPLCTIHTFVPHPEARADHIASYTAWHSTHHG